ncbi:membrane dipeptidase [Gluconacetobacter sacchari]|uniref:Membrane dipeptidase n=2 Tax=Gluconacetobacter sacchari TaxID=92759 RepID=A0A7W4NR05_9PROT|nr:membrane dipeptidase [Gluconacetobacter sacchari]MBB2159645.1 membrane dipeptidase [Gluconacetobacter sacchari]GBQ20702.1 membrane dipeptidase [Gluconacetobacter sacchari DSM 12717]
MTDTARRLHGQSLVIDGLQTCAWSRSVFEEMRAGGLTMVNAASLLWENFSEGMAYIRQWERLFAENADLILPVRGIGDIETARATNRTGISIGWQNTSPLEDRLDYVRLFKMLGVNIMQLTYNTQNYSGAGYLERRDSGLTGFGHEVVEEMNRHGVLCDLSHVGDLTSEEVIAHSRKPVCISHVLPRALRDVKRNKPDHLFRACAEKGGVIGVSLFAPGLKAGNDATIEDYLDAMSHVLNVVGEDHVALGTDFSTGHPRPGPWQVWANRDKGYARTLTEFGSSVIRKPAGFARISETPNVTRAMLRRGWSESRVEKILGLNWMRVFRDSWAAEV